jgi:hypothetical protein
MKSLKTPGRGSSEGFPSSRVVLILLAAMVVIIVARIFDQRRERTY